jgi:hypothetical protein
MGLTPRDTASPERNTYKRTLRAPHRGCGRGFISVARLSWVAHRTPLMHLDSDVSISGEDFPRALSVGRFQLNCGPEHPRNRRRNRADRRSSRSAGSVSVSATGAGASSTG